MPVEQGLHCAAPGDEEIVPAGQARQEEEPEPGGRDQYQYRDENERIIQTTI